MATATLLAGAAASGLLLTWLVLRAGRRRWLSIPNARSSHTLPTPTLGGIGIVVPVLVVAAFVDDPLARALLAGGVPLAIVGALDDVRDLPAAVRWPVHVAATVAALWLMPVPPLVLPPFSVEAAWLVLPLTALLLVWLVNLYNFMDGIDGLAAVQCVTFSAGVVWLGADGAAATLTIALMGAALGFLCLNRAPARIFMGDVASGFLGFSLGVLALALAVDGTVPFVASMVLLTAFWFDATWTLCARMLAGRRFTAPHRDHLYQKLARRFGHGRTTLGYLAMNVLWLTPFAAWADASPRHSLLAVGAAVLPWLVGCVIFRAGTSESDA